MIIKASRWKLCFLWPKLPLGKTNLDDIVISKTEMYIISHIKSIDFNNYVDIN